MNILITVSKAEMDIITELEAWGWLTIPKNVDVVVAGGEIPVVVAVHPTVPVQVIVPPTAPAAKPVVVPHPEGTGPVLATGGAGAAVAAKGGFDAVFTWLIPEEGGYTNDPNDPGGPTMYGIDTKDDEAAWKALGVADIKDLTLAQAKQIYKTKYWDAALCGTMPTPIAETHFNYAVNVGAEQSVKFMQKALGQGLVVDGQYGELTQGALKAIGMAGSTFGNRKAVALAMVDAADVFYKELAQQERFAGDLKGWLNRNEALRVFIGVIS